jgi:hypothetical protein
MVFFSQMTLLPPFARAPSLRLTGMDVPRNRISLFPMAGCFRTERMYSSLRNWPVIHFSLCLRKASKSLLRFSTGWMTSTPSIPARTFSFRAVVDRTRRYSTFSPPKLIVANALFFTISPYTSVFASSSTTGTLQAVVESVSFSIYLKTFGYPPLGLKQLIFLLIQNVWAFL